MVMGNTLNRLHHASFLLLLGGCTYLAEVALYEWQR